MGVSGNRFPRFNWGALVAATLLALVCSACAPASNGPSPQTTSSPPTLAPLRLCPASYKAPANIRKTPGYTELDVQVTGASGNPIRQLKQSDFAVKSGSQSSKVVFFDEDADGPPVALVMLIDTSGSMYSELPELGDSLSTFLGKLNACDEVALLAFSSRPFLLQPFTTEHQLVKQGLSLLHANGQTAMYDSIIAGLATAQQGAYKERAILVVTDGMDNASHVAETDLLAEAKKYGVPIYAIGIGDPIAIGGGLDQVDAETLKEIAGATSGRSFIVPHESKDSGTGLKKALASINDIIGSGYVIGVILPTDSALPTVAIANRPAATARVWATTPSVTSGAP